jgi:peptide/nickel transport system ATP-binding protein
MRATDVWFRYGRDSAWVLSDVSLDVRAGEVVGLRGPSGAGKSTMGRVLAGLLQPQRGEVAVDVDAAGRGNPVQYLAQDAQSAMNPRWRVRDLLDEAGPGAAEDGTGGATGDRGLVEAHWRDRFPHELSGGQLQRVNLARALRARPAYLVADEISASLDAVNQATVWHDLLRVAGEGGLGVLAISHDAPLLERVADRVVDLTP